MKTLLDEMQRRGFIAQITDLDGIQGLIETPQTVYVGFDPTADSLHAGSLVPAMALAHFAKAGHRCIALIGSGTAMVGDPSGKTELRKMMLKETIQSNAKCISAQLQRIIGGYGNVELIENGDWLLSLNYIDFLRDIGRHFSVNRMLTAESYRQRLERGLSFIEFNYQLLQAYDFWHLAHHHDCLLQIGGDDQWGNIVAGIDLIRRLDSKQAYGLTFPLLTTASGTKMGKTERGALWLDPERTSPYEYYQYWINVDDRDVHKLLSLLTMLPIDEIEAAGDISGEQLNAAKTILAFEATAICHGIEEARKAQSAAFRRFGARDIPADLLPSSRVLRDAGQLDDTDVPTTVLPSAQLTDGLAVVELFLAAELAESKGAARRLIQGGGAYLNGERISDERQRVTLADVVDGALMLKAGKKKFRKVVVQ